ncbi:MAG: hydrogenase expression/formation protein [Gammaproteobacteria bacterium]|nr:hydrogenase expression/formation protein [Gammaproteobacteria bacterium]MBU0772654.1 hydrogenase expression/formation protein [Gammaproteobacteria bacterium]MBU0856859.1 hydrogenase expression/formation protein [Gammaproteobacteria bacterium]MBU1846419.1 hydrogenase expression/formation protein [Gammaproteobacteria bacterium]
MKEFPIPVSVIGPGTQVEDESLQYISMPQGMETFRAPILPEPEELVGHERAHLALRDILAQLDATRADGRNRSVDLSFLPADDLKLVNQVMGEGEVSALVSREGDTTRRVQVQESVYAGVWRVIVSDDGRITADTIELGAVPALLKVSADEDVWSEVPRWQGALPPNVQNAPALLAELEDQWRTWRPGQETHVVNLTLLPMSVEDIGFMDHHLGTGRVLILSRGYGNCRITNTCMPNTWRVVYYNSQDVVILNTVEVTALPEVAKAAQEDLDDSFERLREVLAWVEGA